MTEKFLCRIAYFLYVVKTGFGENCRGEINLPRARRHLVSSPPVTGPDHYYTIFGFVETGTNLYVPTRTKKIEYYTKAPGQGFSLGTAGQKG